ncbi:TSUP family transporter [bacterium]|jgi:uncharacterized protein|nr:TSUP family transporter [bacterium]
MQIVDLIIVIAVFSIVQSIFGVGLLLFGTPTLLLIGYSYSETLWILLPCSVTISLIQTVDNYDLVMAKKKVAYFSIPIMTLSLIFVVSYDQVLDISKIVGFFLLFIGVVKFSPKLQTYLQSLVEKRLQLYYVLIGFVHGVSNMGGGPLSILMSTIYTDQVKIRANIAFVYLILALFQLIALFIIDTGALQNISVILMLTSLGVYLIANRYIANKINDKKYMWLINVLILTYGTLAIIK